MFQRLKNHISALPAVQDWPELQAVFERAQPPSELSFWKYPLVVSRAEGDDEFASYPAAAMLCLATGIQLVDDLLDGDLDGVSAGLGAGRAANLAVALHVAAHEVIRASPMSVSQRDQCLRWVSSAAIGTARGQDLDVTAAAGDEETYWRIVEAKSQPLVRAGCALGGVVAACGSSTVESLAAIGGLLGRIIQLQDDLTDALAEPRQQDWLRPASNLAILYAMTAEHADRDRFRLLLESTEHPSDLREAQLILTRSGAVAYCLYHVVQLFRRVNRLARELPSSKPELLSDFLHHHVRSVETLLRGAGLDTPEDLWDS